MKSTRLIKSPVVEKVEISGDTLHSAICSLENNGCDAVGFQEAVANVKSFHEFFEIYLRHRSKRG